MDKRLFLKKVLASFVSTNLKTHSQMKKSEKGNLPAINNYNRSGKCLKHMPTTLILKNVFPLTFIFVSMLTDTFS